MDDQVASVADGLNSINMDSSPSDIEKINQAVRILRQKPNTDPAVSVSSLWLTKKYRSSVDRPFNLNQRVLLEAVEDFKGRVAPVAEQCSELKNLNEVLNRQLEDQRSQTIISRDKFKKVKQSLQTEKEETTRLRLAVDRQRIAKEREMTEKRGLQAQLDAKDKEVGYFIPSLHSPSLVFISDYLTLSINF